WNLGFKQTVALGSDYPYAEWFGNRNFFVYVRGDFNFKNWLKAFKEGKTYVSTGPVIDFTVEGQLPGSEITLKAPGKLKVKLRARINPTLDTLKKIELVSMGKTIAEAIPESKKEETDCTLEYELQVNQSLWIAGKALGKKTAGHTTAIYITVAGKPFWNLDGLDKRITYMEGKLSELENLINDGTIPADQGKYLLGYINKARKVYKDMRARE
ncbi:MAG: CehA/McbA family metallohydrolase, partial [Nitrospirae bacterium]|nr:CehA/McbA family metallohydrolase [Nitrospirota bacterium]